MKERPILFSGPMVRAILAGKKTQTRRVVGRDCMIKPDGPPHAKYYIRRRDDIWESYETMDELVASHSPYGGPGDRLWVRETWCGGQHGTPYHYRASWPEHEYGPKWRPAIHMPRAACRLVLPVATVRLERLQDISEEDAIAEGVRELPLQEGEPGAWWTGDVAAGPPLHGRTPSCAFRKLWDSINGKPRKRSDGSLGQDISWAANPWVWVVTFEVPR